MEYVVIKQFTDKDTKEVYKVGERYPHKGFARKERAEELSTGKNKRGIALIAEKTEKKVEQAVEEPVEAAEQSESAVKRSRRK